jgi:uncharacterized protein
MTQYLSPGVFVKEIPSTIKPIAGVSTSTAGFIGIIQDSIAQPLGAINISTGDGTKKEFKLEPAPITAAELGNAKVSNVKVNGVVDSANPGTAAINNNALTVTFSNAPEIGNKITLEPTLSVVAIGKPQLCTTFGEFTKFFGDFSGDTKHSYLVQAVYGFFNNGGSRCYVARVKAETEISEALASFEAIEEIAMVAAPGLAQKDDDGKKTRTELIAHCQIRTQNRVAIFDGPETVDSLTSLDPKNANTVAPPITDFAAFYFPWLQVFDPVSKAPVYTPPSGHVAGIYARVDNDRGVHKAPANEVVIGALGLKYAVSKAQQEGLNPNGVNCIRNLNGNITVWGARTLGGDINADLKYVNVRRTLLFLRKSIEDGMQWVVFEPNEPGLWQKITRNITAFLTNIWRSGALFGATAQEAFYVRCDAETNPPELRDLGQVVTEIGVSIVRPAEFVIFRISQFTAPGK